MNGGKNLAFDTPDITALSHLYRGGLYRSKSLPGIENRPSSAARPVLTTSDGLAKSGGPRYGQED